MLQPMSVTDGVAGAGSSAARCGPASLHIWSDVS